LKADDPYFISEIDIINRFIAAGFEKDIFSAIAHMCQRMLSRVHEPPKHPFELDISDDDEIKKIYDEIHKLRNEAAKYDMVLLDIDDKIDIDMRLIDCIYNDVLSDVIKQEQEPYVEMLNRLETPAGEPDGDN
jgi:hypothetical protein